MHNVILGIIIKTVLGLSETVDKPLYGMKDLLNKEIFKDNIVLLIVIKTEPDSKRMIELFRAAAEQGHELENIWGWIKISWRFTIAG